MLLGEMRCVKRRAGRPWGLMAFLKRDNSAPCYRVNDREQTVSSQMAAVTNTESTYKCYPQRTVAKNTNPGQNPSTDVALILRERNVASVDNISRVLYEYKPEIH